MTKKYIVGPLVVLLGMGLVGYWFHTREKAAAPLIAPLPPAQTLAFLALPGLPQAWADLRQTKFFAHVSSPAFWEGALGSAGYQRLSEAIHQLEQQLGFPLTQQTLSPLLSRQLGLALVPRPDGLWPVDVIAYLRVSEAEKIVEQLTRPWSAAMQKLVRDTQTVHDTEIVTLRLKGLSSGVSYAFIGTLVVLSTDPAWVVDAIKAHHGTAGDRLHTDPLFQELQVERTESLLTYGYYDVEGLRAQLMAERPRSAKMPWSATLPMLQTTRKMSLKARRIQDGVKLEAFALYPTQGTPQVFRRPEPDGATSPIRGVPAETFYFTYIDHLDLHNSWQLLRQLASIGSEEILEQKLEGFREWAGVDLERDILPVLTGVFGLGITGPFGPQAQTAIALPGFFLALGIADELRASQLMRAVIRHTAGPIIADVLQRTIHNGHEIVYLNNPLLFVRPGYVISRKQLILASDISLLQHLLDAAQGKGHMLAETKAFQAMRKHFRIKGESITFIDVTTVLEKAKEWRARLTFLTRLLTRFGTGKPATGSTHADPWVLLELLRPARYVGIASQGETHGVRVEAFIAFEDLQ